VEAKADLSPEVVRDILRDILAVRGEHGLVALVKDPSFDARETKLDREMREVDVEMDKLLASLGVKL
jgi:hypothetical protein